MKRIRFIMRRFCFIAVLLGFIALLGRAETLAAQQTDQIFIDQVVELDFTPQHGYFLFLDPSKQPVKITAQLLELKQPTSDKISKSWLAAALAPHLLGESKLDFLLVLCAGDDQTNCRLISPKQENGGLNPIPAVTISDLREYLLQRKKLAESWNEKIQLQEQKLRRLREDADTIGEIGRIIDAKDELNKIETEYANIDKDLVALNKFLTLAKGMPQPRSFAQREAELSKQVSKLTELARSVQLGGTARLSAAQQELQHKLALIESTRDQDLDTLAKEYQRLRKQQPRVDSFEDQNTQSEFEDYDQERE